MSEAVDFEAAHFRKIAESKYAFFYILNLAVANNSTFPAILNIEEDSDFMVHSLTGSAYGPCSAEGVRSLNASTDFPLAGTAVPSGAGLGAYADRGLMLQITDSGTSRQYTSGFVPVETILSPGYGIAKSIEQPFKTPFARNSKIRFDFRNRDTQASLYHFISVTLYGMKYPKQG